MGCVKHYLNDLICCVPDNGFAQDAIEHALMHGVVILSGTYDLELDTTLIMREYDRIVETYQAFLHSQLNQADAA